jgi:hypothetical protein
MGTETSRVINGERTRRLSRGSPKRHCLATTHRTAPRRHQGALLMTLPHRFEAELFRSTWLLPMVPSLEPSQVRGVKLQSGARAGSKELVGGGGLV